MATFTNQATLSYGNVVKNSNIVTGELREVLSITKTAVGDSYIPGEKVTYIVSVVNSGSTAYTGLTLTDNLGAYTVGSSAFVPLSYAEGTLRFYENGVLGASPTVTAGPPMTITGISVPAGGNITLVYEADVGATAPRAVEGQITNTASLAGGGLTAALTDTATVTVVSRPELTISKAVCPSTVVENGQLTYTFVIQNSGNTGATESDGIVVNDVFDPKLRDITVTLNGTPLTPTTGYTYDAATGVFTTVEGAITVPAATFTQNTATGVFTVTPGVSVLTVTGTV